LIAAVSDVPEMTGSKWRFARGIACVLERRFQQEKAAPKLLNRAYSALFFS
jgi:hypothetical protein